MSLLLAQRKVELHVTEVFEYYPEMYTQNYTRYKDEDEEGVHIWEDFDTIGIKREFEKSNITKVKDIINSLPLWETKLKHIDISSLSENDSKIFKKILSEIHNAAQDFFDNRIDNIETEVEINDY